MKILFVTNIPSPNRVAFFNELGRLCDLTVTFELSYASDRNKKWIPEKVHNFKPIYLKGIRISADGAICGGLFHILKQKWDCVIFGAYYTPTSMIGMQYMMTRGQTYIIEADGGFIKSEKKIKREIKTHFISHADYWLTSGKFAVDYITYYGANREKCEIFPFSSVKETNICNAIADEEEYQKRRKSARSQLGIGNQFVVLTIGQFIYRKGIDVLLRAVEKSKINTVDYYIVGGEAPDEYLKLKRGNPKVHFEGFKYGEDLNRYYYAADLFVLPTREDIWGLVVNEAFAYGLPVITTDKCGAGLEMITNGKEGYIVPVENSDSIAEIINDLSQDTIKLKKMGLCAAEKSYEYTIESMAICHLNFFEEYCGRVEI